MRNHLTKKALQNGVIRQLMILPGVYFHSILIILSEIGDVTRFPDAKHLRFHAGLVPHFVRSCNVTYRGGIHEKARRRLPTERLQ